jgi:hypothetical protein
MANIREQYAFVNNLGLTGELIQRIQDHIAWDIDVYTSKCICKYQELIGRLIGYLKELSTYFADFDINVAAYGNKYVSFEWLKHMATKGTHIEEITIFLIAYYNNLQAFESIYILMNQIIGENIPYHVPKCMCYIMGLAIIDNRPRLLEMIFPECKGFINDKYDQLFNISYEIQTIVQAFPLLIVSAADSRDPLWWSQFDHLYDVLKMRRDYDTRYNELIRLSWSVLIDYHNIHKTSLGLCHHAPYLLNLNEEIIYDAAETSSDTEDTEDTYVNVSMLAANNI